MAKRFTDTNKWEDGWFSSLPTEDKLFWVYLCDKCDHAGLWKVNVPLVRFYLGPNYNPDPSRFGGRIMVVNNEKWFLPKFVEFQYGELNPDSRVHQSVVSLLKKEGVFKGYAKGMQTLKDKDKDKDKDKETAVVDVAAGGGIPPKVEDVIAYCKAEGKNIDAQHFYDHHQARGWVLKGGQKMKNWHGAVGTWEKNQKKFNPEKNLADVYAGTGIKKFNPKDAIDF